ncbi:N-formimino-L-glutamate deiminase [Ruegeria sp. ANG-S4]|uniref:formimidoylglutamate deiminase n=1 Tax=Ruegeria sp. ANG-S4 TaxID=1577904 RepID=UPI00057F56A3|nr:formimidoylglutamate deiminase [Ruegeria sp. ANG-S4]KIC45179.1 N-formimino-L-glutamate deiminase [Ruegeria sp. ANG-S4]
MPIHAKTAFLGSNWAKNLRVEFSGGLVTAVDSGGAAHADDIQVELLLPALGNLHSHSFQRAMAGRTEVKMAGKESFWTWRSLMYRFLEKLTPEQIEAIAALTFMEMQEAGYAAVGEFHYVHHQQGGTPYSDLSELSQRICAAAAETGIGLTLLPVLYSYGGTGQEALSGGQLRFGNGVDRYLRLVETCRKHLPAEDAVLGIAPHSLRATTPDDLKRVLQEHATGPVHIHIAEQVKEVQDVQAELGQRPVDWLLNNVDVNARWCLIHATHMTDDETRALALSGAVAGLCPITEANLGDGIFNGSVYVGSNGRFGIGSDSNVRISMPEELRTLEYSQRLRDRARTVLVREQGSVGQALYSGALQGGAQALGRNSGEIAVGKRADFVAIDRAHPALSTLADDQLLDGLCFAATDGLVTDLWSAGRHVVRGGRHIARDRIVPAYSAAVTDLLADI